MLSLESRTKELSRGAEIMHFVQESVKWSDVPQNYSVTLVAAGGDLSDTH